MIALSRKKVIGIALIVVVAIALAISLPLALSSTGLAGTTTGFPIKGHLVVEKNGEVLVDKDNIIVNTGYNAIAYYLGTSTRTADTMVALSSGYTGYYLTAFNVIGIGDQTTGPAVGDTNIGGADGTDQARQTGTFASLGSTADPGKWSITHAFTYTEMVTASASTYSGAALAVNEAAVFQEPVIGVVGIMLCHQTFGTITVQAADTLTVTWYFTVAEPVL